MNNFEKDIEKNIFDYSFLFWHYTNPCSELLQLYDKKKDCVECFQGEYKFSGRDWHTGKYWSIPLSESIRYNKRIQVDWLKSKKLTIPPEFLEETIDLRCPDI